MLTIVWLALGPAIRTDPANKNYAVRLIADTPGFRQVIADLDRPIPAKWQLTAIRTLVSHAKRSAELRIVSSDSSWFNYDFTSI